VAGWFARAVILRLCNTADDPNFSGASDEAIHVGMIMRRGLQRCLFWRDW